MRQEGRETKGGGGSLSRFFGLSYSVHTLFSLSLAREHTRKHSIAARFRLKRLLALERSSVGAVEPFCLFLSLSVCFSLSLKKIIMFSSFPLARRRHQLN